MSSAKRRINSTGRKRITRDCVDIRMIDAVAGEPLRATAALKLGDLGFPVTADVAIEAYHRSSGMRFDCGTVGALTIPAVLVLDQVDRSGSVLFRVKVIDNDNDPGKLLGSAERIQPGSREDADGRRSLFPILWRDIGPEVWKVEIVEGDRPKLILNLGMPGFGPRLQEDPLLQGLLLPAALRKVLERLVENPEDGDDEEPGWKAEWLQYCAAELGAADEPTKLDSEGRADWVEDAVRIFCLNGAFMKRIRQMTEAG